MLSKIRINENVGMCLWFRPDTDQ